MLRTGLSDEESEESLQSQLANPGFRDFSSSKMPFGCFAPQNDMTCATPIVNLNLKII